jgi:hypothetical protein
MADKQEKPEEGKLKRTLTLTDLSLMGSEMLLEQVFL